MIDNSELNELYQSIIIEHSKRPRNFGHIECSYHTIGKNPSCGDEVNLYIKTDDNKSRIEDIKFNGEGCALSIASASLMTQLVKGKTLIDSKDIINSFINFIVNNETLDEKYKLLHIFDGVKNFPLRVKCVLLSWRALEKFNSQIKCNQKCNQV